MDSLSEKLRTIAQTNKNLSREDKQTLFEAANTIEELTVDKQNLKHIIVCNDNYSYWNDNNVQSMLYQQRIKE